MRARTWEWPEINCNTCENLTSKVPLDIKRGEAMKYLYYYCSEVDRKIEVEEIIDPDRMPCKGEKHIKIPHQCVSMLRWTSSPHLKYSGYKMRCRRRSVNGTTVCAVHGAVPPKRLREGSRVKPGKKARDKMELFTEEIQEKILAFREDKDLEQLEFELAYLKSMLPRIEKEEGIRGERKYKLLKSTLDSIFKNMEARERITEQRRYSLGLEKVQLLMKLVFEAVKKHVKEREIIKKIGKEMQNIALGMENLGQNQQENEVEEAEVIEMKSLPEGSNKYEIDKKPVKKIKKKVKK